MPCLYITVNHFNKDNGICPWRYFGSDQNDDNTYAGSSKQLKEDIQRLGLEFFTKVIVKRFDNISNRELREIEAKHLKLNNVKKNPTLYNLTDIYGPGGGKKGMKHSKKFERSEKWVASRTGTKWTDEQKSKRKGPRNPMFGKTVATATKEIWKTQRVGANNSNALEWDILDHSTNTVTTIKGLRDFCRVNNLSYGKMYANRMIGNSVTKKGAGKGGRNKKT